jgi:hypothetical protein
VLGSSGWALLRTAVLIRTGNSLGEVRLSQKVRVPGDCQSTTFPAAGALEQGAEGCMPMQSCRVARDLVHRPMTREGNAIYILSVTPPSSGSR